MRKQLIPLTIIVLILIVVLHNKGRSGEGLLINNLSSYSDSLTIDQVAGIWTMNADFSEKDSDISCFVESFILKPNSVAEINYKTSNTTQALAGEWKLYSNSPLDLDKLNMTLNTDMQIMFSLPEGHRINLCLMAKQKDHTLILEGNKACYQKAFK